MKRDDGIRQMAAGDSFSVFLYEKSIKDDAGAARAATQKTPIGKMGASPEMGLNLLYFR
ncbi:hypothetical protein [Desulfuromonas sp. AOP6]|uniref:hypothetical protein n=1 Tax=Desulfuromonas sp. AOP6 TaxID=1566351 RepID=UPI0012DE5BD1|nr:hypothetical protein [Desulfuromonas sp. AOP6]